MTPVVLDTDVVSFLFKSDSRAEHYVPHLRDRQWLISFMTEAELEQWALLSNWNATRITHNASDYLGVPGLKLVSETRT